MSTLIVAAILIAFIVVICVSLIRIHNKQKREAINSILLHFSQMATENNLNFSSQELLNNSVVGIDGINRKILLVTREENLYSSIIIDLNEVKKCSVIKIYGSTKVDEVKVSKRETFIEKIILLFEVYNKPSVEIAFYNFVYNNSFEMQELERKAKHWETILSKMQTPLKNRA